MPEINVLPKPEKQGKPVLVGGKFAVTTEYPKMFIHALERVCKTFGGTPENWYFTFKEEE